MARRAVKIEIDEKLVEATTAVAARAGVPASELCERALRDVVARDFADLLETIAAEQAAPGTTIDDDEGVALAYGELRAAQAERRPAS